MHSACDIVYDLPTSNYDSKKSMCSIVICVLVFLILYNTMSQPYVIYQKDIPSMVSSMVASIPSSLGFETEPKDELPTVDDTSETISSKIEDLKEKKDLPLSADAANSKEDPDATAKQTESDKKVLSEKVIKVVKNTSKLIVMFWAPWCPHCHTAMRPFVLASQMCPQTKFLMVNAEAVDKEKLFKGKDSIVPLTHFPFICRMENGKMVKVHEDAPTPSGIVKSLVPEEASEDTTKASEPNPLDAMFY
jgi:thiol-disulfide isomerase/thioredoxin